MTAPLILDISCLCPAHSDAAIEGMYKALRTEPPDDEIWRPHPSPFVRRLIELFTERGLTRLDGVREELERWLRGEMYRGPAPTVARPAGAMIRWTDGEMRLARLYLQRLSPSLFALEDWLLLADYLTQKYLPQDDLRTEADWLASRASLMGRVQAAMAGATEGEAERALAALPATPSAAEAAFGMSREQRAALEFGRARCAEHVTAIGETARRRMRSLIVDWQEARFTDTEAGAAEGLQSRLLDAFGTLNRDWRRIAVTEASENLNQGYVAAQPVGTRLKRIEKYLGACAFCREIDGKVMTVADPADPEKDGGAQVWVGKTNIGRSASPRRREGGQLVEREPHERWWVAAGAQHPHCRGTWVRVVEGVPRDPAFDAFIADLKRKRG